MRSARSSTERDHHGGLLKAIYGLSGHRDTDLGHVSMRDALSGLEGSGPTIGSPIAGGIAACVYV
jgi:hypothetical protein